MFDRIRARFTRKPACDHEMVVCAKQMQLGAASMIHSHTCVDCNVEVFTRIETADLSALLGIALAPSLSIEGQAESLGKGLVH